MKSIRYFLATWLTAMVLLPAAFAAPANAPLLLLEATEAVASALPHRAVPGSGLEGRFNAGSLSAASLRVQLPDGRELIAQRRNEVRSQRGERTWVGEFTDAPGSLLVVTAHKGLVSGSMHHGAETWEIEAIGPGRSHLYRVDEKRLPPHSHPRPVGAETTQGSTGTAAQASVATAAQPVVQDLLVVYTPAAAAANGGSSGLETKILSAVAAANAGYTNSLVGIQLNVVGMAQTNYAETGDMGVSLTRLTAAADGYMDEVHTLRNQLGADLVALITVDTNYCGIAYGMTSAGSGFAPYAFNVTQPSCFANGTLAHEIGHNQGNAHDRASGGSGAYPYSYGYRTCDNVAPTNGQSFRTIMSYACGSTPRVNNFSNPNVFYNNSAQMGVSYEADPVNSADNARSMNNTGPVTAAFRSGPAGSPPVAPGALVGTPASHDRVDLGWSDNSGNETGFVVQRATAGGSYSDRATLGSNVTFFSDTGLSGSTTYSYRVRAYNSAGSSAYSNAVTAVTPASPPAPAAPVPAAVMVTGSTATVTWANVAYESGYELRRETYNARKSTWTSSTTTAATDVTSLTQSLSAGTYRYSVRAVGAGGASSYATANCSGCGNDGSYTITSPKRGGKP